MHRMITAFIPQAFADLTERIRMAPKSHAGNGSACRRIEGAQKDFENKMPRYINDLFEHMAKLPADFCGTLILDMKWANNMTEYDLSIRTGISEVTISRLRTKHDYTREKETVIKLCLGLQLPYILSEDLLRKAGIVLTSSKQDLLYSVLLQKSSEYTVRQCSMIMEKLGLKPFKNMDSAI